MRQLCESVISRTMKLRSPVACTKTSGRCSLSSCAAGPFQCASRTPPRRFGTADTRISSREKAVVYPRIDAIHGATKLSTAGRAAASLPPSRLATGSGEIKLPPPAFVERPFGEVARMRRSALDFRGWNAIDVVAAALGHPCCGDAAAFCRFCRCTFHPALSVRPSR